MCCVLLQTDHNGSHKQAQVIEQEEEEDEFYLNGWQMVSFVVFVCETNRNKLIARDRQTDRSAVTNPSIIYL